MALAAGPIFYKKAQERFLCLETQNNFFPALQNFTFSRPRFSFSWKQQTVLQLLDIDLKDDIFLSAFHLIHE